MRSKAPLVLTLDQGGHASRALIFDMQGKVVSRGEATVRTLHPGTNRVEHAPKALIASLRRAAEMAVKRLPRTGGMITTAALATQRSTIVCWDRTDGRALSPVISWQDRRAMRTIAALASHADTVRRTTGLPLSPHYGASKIAWCLKHLPTVKRARRVGRLAAGPLASYLLTNLLEERPCLVDPVNGSRTLLLDTETGDWSPGLCQLFGIPVEILPVCVPNRHPFGHLQIGGRDIPLEVVTGDQPAALFAMGQPARDTAYINIGTGAFIQSIGDARVDGLLRSTVWRDASGERRVVEGTVNGASSALDEVGARLGIPPRQRIAEAEKALNGETEPPLYLNGVGGLGAPFWRPGFRSHFIGRGTAGAKLAAVIESIVFLLLVNLEAMRSGSAILERLVVTGGLARSDALCRRLANLSGLRVIRPDLHEATALGLARLAADMNEAPPPVHDTFGPEPDVALNARYRRWRATLDASLAES